MIRLLNNNDKDKLMEFLKKDVITNYFVILSLERSEYEEMFQKKWGEFNENGDLTAALLKRRTSNMQFYSRGDYNAQEFANILKNEGFIKLIGEETIVSKLKEYYQFTKEERGPFISRMDRIEAGKKNSFVALKRATVIDVDRIIELYEKTFHGYATKRSMLEKYHNRTGRGYFIEDDGKLVSVAQSSYESLESAIITGVATHPDYRNNGYASLCVSKLCAELIGEGKSLYLQYDNEPAGNIYRRLGFYNTGRMCFLFS